MYKKFALFMLYGLLSVASIALAQQLPAQSPNDCSLSPISPSGQITIGYFNQLESIDPETIRWDYYDYVNVVANPKGINSLAWNDIHPPDDINHINLLNNFIKARQQPTKILLSIRNFDLSKWPNNETGYDVIFGETTRAINTYNLDGIDIEYPGMRGRYCKDPGGTTLWDSNTEDGDFINFIKNLRDGITKNKTLMLTVGSDPIMGLNDYIDFLNIETYHYSFYDNYKNPPLDNKVRSNPNAPLNVYEIAYNAWVKSGIDSKKIIMGIDLGNTLQVIDNPDIENVQTVEFGTHLSTPSLINLIKFCPIENDDNLSLYLFPWNQLTNNISSSSVDKCYDFNGWERKFDSDTSTSWLHKRLDLIPPGGGTYDYVSYEDFISLNKKLSFAISKSIGGISISDVSYDSIIDNVSLVNYLQVIRQNQTDNSACDGNPSYANKTNDESKTAKPGVIIGAVFGSIFGLLLIFITVLYRRKYKNAKLSGTKNSDNDAHEPRSTNFFLWKWFKNKNERKSISTSEVRNSPQEILQIPGGRSSVHNQGKQVIQVHNHRQEVHDRERVTNKQEAYNYGQEVHNHGQEVIPTSENAGTSKNIDLQDEIIQLYEQ